MGGSIVTKADAGELGRLVMVPSWGTRAGDWTRIRDVWPNATHTFMGAGLDGEDAPVDWSPRDDAAALSATIASGDVLCAAGWTAEIVLLAAALNEPSCVLLWSPPLGVDLSSVVDEAVRDPDKGAEFMAAFGGDEAYWQRARRAANFHSRVLAYLRQDVVRASSSVTVKVVVATRSHLNVNLPKDWRSIVCEPGALPVVLSLES